LFGFVNGFSVFCLIISVFLSVFVVFEAFLRKEDGNKPVSALGIACRGLIFGARCDIINVFLMI